MIFITAPSPLVPRDPPGGRVIGKGHIFKTGSPGRTQRCGTRLALPRQEVALTEAVTLRRVGKQQLSEFFLDFLLTLPIRLDNVQLIALLAPGTI